MNSTNPEMAETAPSQPSFRGRWILVRIAFLILHVAAVVAAASLTPDAYYFQLGEYTGAVVMFSSIALWFFLFAIRTRAGIILFCCLALGQAGFVALVGMHLRAVEKVTQSIEEEISRKRREWALQLNPDSMRPLAELISGERTLSVDQLQELSRKARSQEAQVDLVELDVVRSRADAEPRIGSISARAAHSFHLGAESTKQLYEQEMRLTKDYFTDCEKLSDFLIDRQGQFSQTTEGLKFKKAEDAQSFNEQRIAISLSLQKIASVEQQLRKD